MIVLGIDTSCDDTGVGIVRNGTEILSNVIASQHGFHRPYGGIVPSVAARRHTQAIGLALEKAMSDASVSLTQIDGVAVTNQQGLSLALSIGVSAAKSVALAAGAPLVGVHHVEGHVNSCVLGSDGALQFPFLCLTVAGGHTILLLAHDFGDYELIGTTRDDALGEVYDKLARRMGLGYPGGPIIDRLAPSGNADAFNFPRPMMRDGWDFSFSGLKTAVRVALDDLDQRSQPYAVEDVAAAFQSAAMDVIVSKTVRAAVGRGVRNVGVAGGVAANRLLRTELRNRAAREGIEVFFPPMNLCVDNGAMIAAVGHRYLDMGRVDGFDLDTTPNAPLGARRVQYRAASKYR